MIVMIIDVIHVVLIILLETILMIVTECHSECYV